ncbi:MAG: isoleucine--tRNA ligase, partial [Kiritimatiellaeota bacterium]|nr:isoleucine--tRNA ligase [Kiritimatiellota bacterium]
SSTAFENAYLLIWTTTPWTLPGNLAICAGPDIEYAVVKDGGDTYILATERVAAVFGKDAKIEVVRRMKGAELAGLEYEPIFPHFADRKAFRVLNDGFVTTTDGTGLVHCAPAYGEDDFRVCRENGITEITDPLDTSCNFTEQLPEYAGRFCKDCDKDIIKRLKTEGKLVHQTTLVHSYPYCDRTDTPLIYRAIEAWYVHVEDAREKLAACNETVRWMPEYVGDKRFGNWLREAKDWNISRNRFWGSCIPVWVNEADDADRICVGSIAELEALSGEKVTDLHKHFVDAIVIRKDGKTYRRTPEVLDCWFESGAMPYAQQHYPFAIECDRGIDSFFPADFIAEGLDQTRGWFYTLLVLGALLFEKAPYRNVVVNGLVLAEDGKKMSKRLKNYPDPTHILETYGADALRLYMIYSPVVRAENLRFSETGVRQILRDLLIPLWNAYSFFVTYANVDGFHEPDVTSPASPNDLDRWICSSLETLVEKITAAMDAYNLQQAVRPFVLFVDDLTNWYIRRSRRRFWKSQNDDDKLHAYRTLRHVLVQFSKIAAPFTPFISETIYRNLRGASDPESVHLCDFPKKRSAGIPACENELVDRMALAQTVVRLGRQLRIENDLKIRQPLAALHVVSANPGVLAHVAGFEEIAKDELNIKTLLTGSDETALADLTLKADFRKLGPRLGAKMKAAAATLANLPCGKAHTLATGGTVSIEVDGQTFDITADDVAIQRSPKPGLIVAAEGDLLVALETTLTPGLVAEGLARELVSQIQNLRKERDLEVTQRIRVTVATDAEVEAAVRAHEAYICAETLAVEIAVTPAQENGGDLNGHPCVIALEAS